jgi:hypothetical protein
VRRAHTARSRIIVPCGPVLGEVDFSKFQVGSRMMKYEYAWLFLWISWTINVHLISFARSRPGPAVGLLGPPGLLGHGTLAHSGHVILTGPWVSAFDCSLSPPITSLSLARSLFSLFSLSPSRTRALLTPVMPNAEQKKRGQTEDAFPNRLPYIVEGTPG